MRNDEAAGAWKVWCYAAISVGLGAWLSPGIFHAGQALAEVSQGRTTNGLFDWLADWCRGAEFPAFFAAGVLVVAAIGFFPWLEWLHWRRGERKVGLARWGMRLPGGIPAVSQWRWRHLRGPWQGAVGFLGLVGLLMGMAWAAGGDAVRVRWGMLPGLLVLAWAIEAFFRGLVLGIFRREMRPAAALAMSALFFAIVMSLLPPAGVKVADPEAAGLGFAVLRDWWLGMADWRLLVTGVLPWLALGLLLGNARMRSGSLWLPVGMLGAWLFFKATFVGSVFVSQGLVPLVAMALAAVLVRFLISQPDDATELHS